VATQFQTQLCSLLSTSLPRQIISRYKTGLLLHNIFGGFQGKIPQEGPGIVNDKTNSLFPFPRSWRGAPSEHKLNDGGEEEREEGSDAKHTNERG